MKFLKSVIKPLLRECYVRIRSRRNYDTRLNVATLRAGIHPYLAPRLEGKSRRGAQLPDRTGHTDRRARGLSGIRGLLTGMRS